MTKAEIRKAIARFRADEGRVVSEYMFCELAGIGYRTFRQVFVDGTNMSVQTQLRVERALKALERGDVRIMQGKGGVRSVEYRREPRPDLRRGFGLQVKDGKIGLKIGVENANCYTAPTLKDQLED